MTRTVKPRIKVGLQARGIAFDAEAFAMTFFVVCNAFITQEMHARDTLLKPCSRSSAMSKGRCYAPQRNQIVNSQCLRGLTNFFSDHAILFVLLHLRTAAAEGSDSVAETPVAAYAAHIVRLLSSARVSRRLSVVLSTFASHQVKYHCVRTPTVLFTFHRAVTPDDELSCVV